MFYDIIHISMYISLQVPLLRWKRFAVVAAMCIFAVRAVIVQIAFYLHIQVMIWCVAFSLHYVFLIVFSLPTSNIITPTPPFTRPRARFQRHVLSFKLSVYLFHYPKQEFQALRMNENIKWFPFSHLP